MYEMGHIAIVVRDIEVSKEFYISVLGGKVTHRSENDRLYFLYLDVNGSIIELLEYKGGYSKRNRGPIDHLAFYVKNLDWEIKRLKNLNINLLFDYPMETNGMKIMFFTGPDDERIEFIEKIKS